MLHLFTLEQLINNHWHLEILAFVPSATCEGNVSKSRQSILSVTFATYIQLLILFLWSFAFISLILICIRVFLLGINGQRGGWDQGGGSILPHSKYNDNATTLRLPCFNRKPLLLLLLLLAAPLVSHFKALKRFAPTPLLVSSSKRQILCEYWKEEEKGPMEYDHSWQFQCSTVKRRRTKNNQMIETTK